MEDKKILDMIHLQIHALRFIQGYKPSEFEKWIAKIITDKYRTTCQECEDKFNEPPKLQQSGNFLDKILGRNQ